MADRIKRNNSSASQRASQFSMASENVFGDEFALEPFVVDGYQPTSLSSRTNENDGQPSSSRSHSRRSVALQPKGGDKQDGAEGKPPSQQRNSRGFGVAPRNSFSLRHDAPYSSDNVRRTLSTASTTTNGDGIARHDSTRGHHAPARTQSPFVGATAPSHPYGMYPQNTANRMSTISNALPTVPDQAYRGPTRPTHDYGMYAQTTIPEGQAAFGNGIGFPGHEQQFARRLGPESEGADDIIGPDGHTEQLPPYSRYPDRPESAPPIPRKNNVAQAMPSAAGASVAGPSMPSSSSSTVQAVPQSATSERSTHSAFVPDPHNVADDAHLVGAGSPHREDFSTKEVSVLKRRQRTCCGKIRVWVAILIGIVVVAIAAIIGGAVGRMMRSRTEQASMPNNTNQSSAMNSGFYSDYPMITTTFIDAIPPTATPANLPPAPTGNYIFAMGPPSQVSSGCIQAPGRTAAWACPGAAILDLDVNSGQTNLQWRTMGLPPSYGAIPPSLEGPSNLSLMQDRNEPDRGIALWFSGFFNKTVLIPFGGFNSSGVNLSPDKRWLDHDEEDAASELDPRESLGQIPDNRQLWSCFWNHTLLEGFIYLTQNISQSESEAAWVSSVESSGQFPTAFASAALNAAASTAPSPIATAGSSSNGDQGGSTTSWECYPKVVKIEERRIGVVTPEPYCELSQMKNGTIVPVIRDGSPIHVPLEEATSDDDDDGKVNGGRRSRQSEDGNQRRGFLVERVPKNCQCQWLDS